MRQLITFTRSASRFGALLLVALAAAAPGAGAQSTAAPSPAPHRNVYAAGGEVRPAAVVQGDFLAAGGRIVVDQRVGGDANLAGGAIDVRAPIGEDLRVVGGDITVGTTVGGELVAAGGNVLVRSDAAVAGPARIRAGNAVIDGRIGGDLDAAAQKITINTEVRGDVRLAAEEVELGPQARIAGALEYASASELKKAPGATIAGPITRTEAPLPPRERRRHAPGTFWAGGIFTFVALLACAALLLLLAPGFAARAPLRIRTSPWSALGLGLATLVAVPVLAVMLFITLLGIPLGIAVMALYPVLMLAGFLVGALFVAELLPGALRRPAPQGFAPTLGYLAIALVLVLLVARVPFAGPLVLVLASLAGIGAGLLEWRHRQPARHA